MSKGEEKISFILKSAHIPYEKEYTFPDLTFKKSLLRFDFAILSCGRPIKLIEFDGEQHFKHIAKFGTYSDFKHMQENDRRKNRYCLLNNIPLYRIPYWELNNIVNFQSILKQKFLVKTIYHNDLLINN